MEALLFLKYSIFFCMEIKKGASQIEKLLF